MSEHNPWDQTIWDPINPEQAEDPMHGPSAVHAMLQTPAMPRGDGTYYQPGAYSTHGTAYEDSKGRPVYGGIGGSIMAGMREGLELREWLEAHSKGDEALTALEARRQQARLEKTGFAHCFKPSDVCPGGRKLEDCETGDTAYQTGQEWAAKNDQEKPGDGTVSNVVTWAGSKCVGCSVFCEVAVKTVDGKPKETRVTFYKSGPDIQTIHIDQ